jgi:hypothetical protein
VTNVALVIYIKEAQRKGRRSVFLASLSNSILFSSPNDWKLRASDLKVALKIHRTFFFLEKTKMTKKKHDAKIASEAVQDIKTLQCLIKTNPKSRGQG